MSRRSRKKNANAPAPEETPTPVTSDTSTPEPAAPDADELRVLRERLETLERTQAGPDAGWNPVAAHRAEQDAWVAQRTREGGAPCAACGGTPGVLRKVDSPAFGWSLGWLCDPCTQAVEPGWGTLRRTLLNAQESRNRLACLAAGLDAYVPGFLALAQRYGLTFSLACESDRTTAGAWGHLDVPAWREVGVKAQRRRDAGFGMHPAPLPPHLAGEPESGIGSVVDWGAPGGARPGIVTVEPPQPSPEELASLLRAEEEAVDAALAAQERERVRAEKEAAAKAAEEAHRREVLAHYEEHKARLEAQIEQARAGLKGDLDRALQSPADAWSR